VAPFEVETPVRSTYYLVSNEVVANGGIVGDFRQWRLNEARPAVR
jgi:hypothetical protein